MLEGRHESRDDLARLFRGETTPAEIERVATHLVGCKECWNLAIRAIADQESAGSLSSAGPLKAVVELYRLEQGRLEEGLVAQAAWIEIRSLGLKTRRDKVRLTRSLHTFGFLETLLTEARGGLPPKESEELAYLALIVTQQLPAKYTPAMKSDFAAECCAEIANARRRAANWPSAREALKKGTEYVSRGSGNPVVEGQLLCVSAALEADLGFPARAGELLHKAVRLFETAANWSLVSRALVQLAFILTDADPKEGLRVANQALALIPPANQRLTLFAENVRVDCLIALGAHREALLRFQALKDLHEQFLEPFIQLRRRFTAARLLESLGQLKRAEKIFYEVIAGDLEHGLVKDLFLDLVYLFGAYLRYGDAAGALSVCRRAVQELSLLEDEDGSGKTAREQMQAVWLKLQAGIQDGTVNAGAVTVMREYIKAHWRTPAAELPSFRAL